MGLLGTRAALPADLNLILQLVIITVLVLGRQRAKEKKLGGHGRLMTFAVLANAVGILIVMGPSLLSGLGFITSHPAHPGSLISVAHSMIGGLAEIMGAYLAISWRLSENTAECFKRKRLMKPTMGLWMIAALTGIGFYVYFYIVS